MAFMAVTVVVFLILGCLLEGLPAVLLLAPIMFPIAKKLGINDIHYSMVIVCAMNVGLMMPPIGVGFYIACRIGDAKPDEVIVAIWPYIAALVVGVIVIAAFPVLSTFMLLCFFLEPHHDSFLDRCRWIHRRLGGCRFDEKRASSQRTDAQCDRC